MLVLTKQSSEVRLLTNLALYSMLMAECTEKIHAWD